MKNLVELLNSAKNISGWRVASTARKTDELFFVHEKLETVCSTETTTTVVTVYVEHDGAVGDSSFSVFESMSTADIEEKIALAAARAALVYNQPYSLVEGDGKFEGELPTNLKCCDGKALAEKVAAAVFAFDSEKGGSINATEVFFYRDEKRVLNSRGVDKTQTAYRVMVEAIPTFTTDKESVEIYESYTFTTFDEQKIIAEITEKMKEVRARAEAVKPQTPMTVDVALRPHEISELLGELAQDVNYSVIYMKGNMHKIGDDIQPECSGDKLTLTMRAVVEGSASSAFFDGDGTTLSDVTVIKDGVVSGSYGSMRFGQYLGVEKPSGSLSCFALSAGSLDRDGLKDKRFIECVSLSGLQVDAYNDYIGGEIRLAYMHDGDKVTPITGITMSAKLSEVFKTLRLSDREVVEGAYEGPDLLLMKNVTVL